MQWVKLSKLEVKWCLYDVGNSAFYTTIVAGFFPIFFKQYWNQGVDPNVSTYYLSLASSTASLVVALMAPFIGALVDRFGRSQLWLAFFTVWSVIGCVGLARLGDDQTQTAMWVFCGISVGAALAVAIYDAMLMKVTVAHRLSKVSLWGYALGYLGGGVLFSMNIALTLKPEWFGLRDSVAAVKVSFIMVGLWWLGFSLPLMLSRRIAAGSSSEPAVRVGWCRACLQALGSLYETMRTISSHKSVVWFLVAYWFYIDGVGTVMRMAVDYGMSLGFAPSHLMIALLVVQLLGFPCSLGFIWIANHWGAIKGLYVGIGIYMLITLGAYFMQSVSHFYGLAVGVALAQGGLQALSRSTFAQLVPPEKSSEFFGFYNTFGKFAATMGPLILGWVALATGSNRLAILSVLGLFGVGAVCLSFVRISPVSSPTHNP